MVLTFALFSAKIRISSIRIRREAVRYAVRNLLPCTFDVVDLGRNTQVTFCSDFVSNASDLGCESSELFETQISSVLAS
jgi:hypothetical protein